MELVVAKQDNKGGKDSDPKSSAKIEDDFRKDPNNPQLMAQVARIRELRDRKLPELLGTG